MNKLIVLGFIGLVLGIALSQHYRLTMLKNKEIVKQRIKEVVEQERKHK